MTTNDQQTTYAQLAAKVEAVGLQVRAEYVDGTVYGGMIFGRDCEPHLCNILHSFYRPLGGGHDNKIRKGTIDDCIAAVLATEPAPPAHVAELVAACKASLVFIEQELTRRYMRDMTLEALEKAIEKAPLLNQLRAAIAKHEANHPGANP